MSISDLLQKRFLARWDCTQTLWKDHLTKILLILPKSPDPVRIPFPENCTTENERLNFAWYVEKETGHNITVDFTGVTIHERPNVQTNHASKDNDHVEKDILDEDDDDKNNEDDANNLNNEDKQEQDEENPKKRSRTAQ